MAYDLGDVVTLTFPTRDAAGNPADAGAVTLTVTGPDGTVTTVATTHVATGTYSAVYTPTAPGHHDVYWQATGANASAYEDAFNVRARHGLLVGLAEVRVRLDIPATQTQDDELIRQLIAVATRVIENRVGPILPMPRTDYAQVIGDTAALPYRVASVTSVASVYGQGIDSAAFYPWNGLLRRTPLTFIAPGPYLVTYMAGFNPIPADLLDATVELVAHLYETRRGTTPTPIEAAEAGLYAPATGYSLPHRVEELIEPYLTAAIA